MMRDFWRLAKPYWVSEEKWKAIGLLVVVIALNLGNVYILVQLNEWRGEFYDSLQKLDKVAFGRLIWVFAGWAFAYVAIAVYAIYLMQLLQIWWRTWMTDYFMKNWLGDRTYYLWQLKFQSTDNPDQRIADDIGRFVAASLGLSLGLLKEIVTLFSFLGMLWTLAGPMDLPWFGGIHIPGYMVWICLLYSVVGTILAHWIGRRLVGLNFNQQRFEADFRFNLIRLRENAESIALSRGEAAEKRNLHRFFSEIVLNFKEIMDARKKLGAFQSFYGQAAVIFPYLVSAGKFFAKEITLGTLMRLASAFNQVQDSLSYFISAYTELAEWSAVIQRLTGFVRTVEEAQQLPHLHHAVSNLPSGDRDLSIVGLELSLPDGKALVEPITLTVEKGSSILISGPSGSGKSTMIRAVAGIWPFAKGKIGVPEAYRSMVLPQKPYLPVASLRTALLYPEDPASADGAMLHEVLKLCRLSAFESRLDEEANWSLMLSPGEQQRVAFARVFLQKPSWVFLDEATSALDETTEAMVYRALREQIPGITIISVGHRSSLQSLHEKHYYLEASAGGVPSLVAG